MAASGTCKKDHGEVSSWQKSESKSGSLSSHFQFAVWAVGDKTTRLKALGIFFPSLRKNKNYTHMLLSWFPENLKTFNFYMLDMLVITH